MLTFANIQRDTGCYQMLWFRTQPTTKEKGSSKSA